MMGMEVDVSENMPEITLNTDQLPEIADWKVGEEYTISMKVEQVEVHKMGEEGLCAHFKVLSAKPVKAVQADKEEVAKAVSSKMNSEYEEE